MVSTNPWGPVQRHISKHAPISQPVRGTEQPGFPKRPGRANHPNVWSVSGVTIGAGAAGVRRWRVFSWKRNKRRTGAWRVYQWGRNKSGVVEPAENPLPGPAVSPVLLSSLRRNRETGTW